MQSRVRSAHMKQHNWLAALRAGGGTRQGSCGIAAYNSILIALASESQSQDSETAAWRTRIARSPGAPRGGAVAVYSTAILGDGTLMPST